MRRARDLVKSENLNTAHVLQENTMTDEDQLIDLLQQHQSLTDPVERKVIAGQILELVDTYFRHSLRP